MFEEIKKIIKKVVGEDVDFQILESERPEFGQYSTNAPFLLAKKLGKSPFEIAKDLEGKIKEKDKGKLFSKVEAAPPGYVNFWISVDGLANELKRVVKLKKIKMAMGRAKVNLEFISANPTGPLTMANGRGGFLGDVLANVLEFAGQKVTKEYYINDAGTQIKLLGESVLAALGKAAEKEEHYKGGYIKETAEAIKNKIKDSMDAEEVGRLAAEKHLSDIKKTTEKAGIKFDIWYSEYEKLRGNKGLIQKVMDVLNKNKLVLDKEGAKWLKSEDIADEKDRVLVKSDGQPTYFLADLAYHYDKFLKRKFDKVIDIWGADHHGYVARLKGGMKALGLDSEKLTVIITQLVRLVEGGKEVRMSKRKGEFVTLDELIEEVGGVDPVRYFFLMHAPETHMDFDLALAKERSLKNPVYYVQYAYVRALSILKRANPKSEILNPKQIPISKLKNLKTESELALLNELVKFPYMVGQTAEDCQVHRLTTYASVVARALHYFYEKERVLEAEPYLRDARLALVSATKTILEKLFKILGISAPERM